MCYLGFVTRSFSRGGSPLVVDRGVKQLQRGLERYDEPPRGLTPTSPPPPDINYYFSLSKAPEPPASIN